MTVASHDFETRSIVDLKSAGVDRYAKHEWTSITALSYAIEDDPVSVFLPGDKDPHKLLDHIEGGGMLAAWNAPFEIAVWRYVIPRQFPHWPIPSIEQFECTMARAQALALPASLEQCAIAVNVPFRKDKAGYSLMMKLCRPTKAWRDNPVGPPQWNEDPDDLKRQGEYCAQDTVVERAIGKQVARLSERERKVWLFDRKVNDRGIRIDVPKVEAALKVVNAEKDRLTADLVEITGGKVRTANSPKQMLAWFAENDCELPNLKRRPLSRLLRTDRFVYANDPDLLKVKRALEIRLEIARASTAKLTAMLACKDEDDRCRGCFGYHIATTGRWAARRIQPHNFPRPVIGSDGKPLMSDRDIDEVFEMLGAPSDGELIRLTYADPMPAIATCLRGFLVPEKGKLFIGGDYTGIENRVLMWLANEEWMIREFERFDAGQGVDNYKLAFSKAFNVPLEQITSQQRLIGKVASLACGYAGAVGAYISMGDNYDVIPGDVARATKATASQFAWEAAASRWPDEEKWRFGLTKETWTGIRVAVDAWRSAHPNVTQLWWDLIDCAIQAVLQPKCVINMPQGKLRWVSNRSFLFCRLPSGRLLAYARPEVVTSNSGRQELYYYGQGKKSKKWERRKLTPAIASENVTSGTARDVLVDGMLRLEQRGYPITLHVHDEAVSEVERNFGSPEEFESILCDSERWLAGLPVAAKAWTGYRFQK